MSIIIDETKILGTGAQATIVFEGIWDKRPIAVKRVLESSFKYANKEIETLRKFDFHSNVVRYFFHEVKNGYIYIGIELCLLSLDEFIKNRNIAQKFQEISAKREIPLETFEKALKANSKELLYQATEGLNFLHNNNIVHQDVKPQNILVSLPRTSQTNEFLPEFIVKISDFGLSKKIDDGDESFSNTSGLTGTQGWVAPEVLKDDKNWRKVYWSFVIVLFSNISSIYFAITDKSDRFVFIGLCVLLRHLRGGSCFWRALEEKCKHHG